MNHTSIFVCQLTEIMKASLGSDGCGAAAGTSGEIDVSGVLGCHDANDVTTDGAASHEGVTPLLHRR